MITLAPLHPLFVAEVGGVDLRREMDKAAVETLVAALDRHAVLVLRNQPLTNAEQIAFSRNFGPIETTVGAALKGNGSRLEEPRIAEVSNLGADGSVRAPDDKWRLMQRANEFWHTDSSFKPRSGKISLLSAHECPRHGGETEFADLRAAYDELDAATRAEIADLWASHSMLHSRRLAGYTELAEEASSLFPPVAHPIVRLHPGSQRRTLYLASHASHIIGWPHERGRALLDRLTAFATQRRFVYRHQWQVDDLVIWDNRCTMHRARPYDEFGERRDMRRTTIVDEEVPAPFVEEAR